MMLRNPHAALTRLIPHREEDRTPHWVAAVATLLGADLLLVNVYAPIAGDEREQLFAVLSDVLRRHDGPILLGATLTAPLSRTWTARNGQPPLLTTLWGCDD